MKVKLSGYRKDRFVLIHWYMDLKNEDEKLSFNEKKQEYFKNRILNRVISYNNLVNESFMIIKFDILGGELLLNRQELFKYRYKEETLYMGGREKFQAYIVDYFSEASIQTMLKLLIEDANTKEKYKSELSLFLVSNVKQKIVEKDYEKGYYRYSIKEEDNETFISEINYLINVLKAQTSLVSFGSDGYVELSHRIVNLKNILKNVKHIKVTDKKINATFNARNANKERSISKIENAYEVLKKNKKKITIYAIAKEAHVSHPTAKKYSYIFKNDLV